MERILVIGACGQLGSELTNELGKLHGTKNVIASDISNPNKTIEQFTFVQLDVMDKTAINKVITEHQITQVYHLAAILSAKGEENPQWAWNLNMTGLLNILEAAKDHKLKKSIGLAQLLYLDLQHQEPRLLKIQL